MNVIERLTSYLRSKVRKQPEQPEIDLSDPNTKRILDKQYTAEELEIKQMLKDIDNKRR